MMSEEPGVTNSEICSTTSWGISIRASALLALSDNGIGAGSGYYVVRLSPIVGPRGRIIAEDVVPEYLRGLRKRVRYLGLQNVVIGIGELHDPRLPADSLDIAILVHMYHEIAQPYGLLYNLVPALKLGARVGIVDAYGPTSQHGTPPDLLRCELAESATLSQNLTVGVRAYGTCFNLPVCVLPRHCSTMNQKSARG